MIVMVWGSFVTSSVIGIDRQLGIRIIRRWGRVRTGPVFSEKLLAVEQKAGRMRLRAEKAHLLRWKRAFPLDKVHKKRIISVRQ